MPSNTNIEVKTVIGVPGRWKTHKELVQEIAAKSDGLVLVGSTLMDMATEEVYELEIYDHDARVVRAFELAGRQSISQTDIEAIKSHTVTLYLVANGGSVQRAQRVLEIGCGLLKAGGLAVKVETTGKAHSAKDWVALAGARTEYAIHDAFVTFVGNDDSVYSCGMHNLGYRDAILRKEGVPEDPGNVLRRFSLYVLIANPDLADGHTVSENQDSPRYRINAVPCETYPDDYPFYNPFGMWRLKPISHR